MPPAVPVLVTVTVPGVAFWQNGVPVYTMVAAGNAVMVIVVVAVTCAHPPPAAMV